MELLTQVSNTQFLFPVAAVAVVLVCAALVFVFGFHSAEQPQFDKLPLVVDDRKSSNKKRKTKDKKSSPNRSSNEDVKTKSESTKKSPTKEKVKEAEKPKPKERQEPKPVKKESKDEAKKGKGRKQPVELEKPADFDEGVWEEVPKKEKKKVKSPEEKEKKKDNHESPTKKNKKVVKDADVEAARSSEEPAEETIKVISAVGPEVDEDAARALQAQVEEFQRVLKEAERREQAALGGGDDENEPEVEEIQDVKDLRSNKKKENKEKQIKKKATENAAIAKNAPKPEPDNTESSDKQEDKQNVPVFDELGDTWIDASKTSKKSKKKARKDQ
ncbi:triadin-like [Ostrinia nubilalis]|uniref:triadin-like n=1 Tax=Ostrinia nubilalis TaxID=29057 RepID=UPI0030825855